jgi:hypothetical protein
MAKFKVVKVYLLGYKDKTYAPGEIVEISEADVKRLTPCDYLEPLAEPMKTGKPRTTEK